MRVKITTKIDKNLNELESISPLSVNKKIVYFLEKGFKPDDLGYLHKGNKYIKLEENAVKIVNKRDIWTNGIAKNVNILHISD